MGIAVLFCLFRDRDGVRSLDEGGEEQRESRK